MTTGEEDQSETTTNEAAEGVNAASTLATPAKNKARRLAVLLVSSGIWLLYFDLLTSTPGCTPSSTNESVDAASSYVDAPADAPMPDAPDPAVVDADLTDAATLDASPDAPELLEASTVDAPDLLDASTDAPDLFDASMIDGPDLLDASMIDAPASGCNPALTVVTVYPTGGETGATYNHDFVSIRNRSNVAVSLSGFSLQVQDGTSTGDWHVIALTGTIQANGFYMVRLGSAAGDAGVGSNPGFPTLQDNFDLPSAGGRVAIVASGTALTGPGPFSTVDLVGYGSTYTAESGAVTFSGAANKGVVRAGAGCTDTDHNSLDLAEGTPITFDAYFNPAQPCACN
ncbi:MAG: hypothetical protein U0235_03200 [Polyangiaceae bacterium]